MIALLVKLLTRRWFWRFVLLSLIAFLIWNFAQFITIDRAYPFQSPGLRLFLIFLIVAATLLLPYRGQIQVAWDKWRLARSGVSGSEGDFNVDAVETRLRILERLEAVFETTRGADRKASAATFYAIPWYLVIGPQGSGKTTFIRHTELDFLPTQPAGGTGGPTEIIDIWQARQAVFVDVAGGLVISERGDPDRPGWSGLIELLAHYRQRRPVNGILAVLSLSDILDPDDGRRANRLETLRRRITEATERFGARTPVHLIVTRMDLAAGFSEFFESLPVEERERPWGFTLPMMRSGDVGSQVIERCAKELGILEERVNNRLSLRLNEERDITRRCLVMSYGLQFRGFTEKLGSAINHLTGDRRGEASLWLRGVFMTSATRANLTPEQLFGLVSSPFTLDPSTVPPPSNPDRTLFMTRLLSDAILPELDLIGRNVRVETGITLLHVTYYGLAVLALLLIGSFWVWTFQRNQAKIAVIQKVLMSASLSLRDASNNSDISAIIPTLYNIQTASSQLPRSEILPYVESAGLTVDTKLYDALSGLYSSILRQQFHPRLLNLAHEQLDQAVRRNDQRSLRQALRIYLMLSMPGRANPDVLKEWGGRVAQSRFALYPEQGNVFQSGMNSLLDVGVGAQPQDQVLVEQARSLLVQTTPSEQTYDGLKAQAAHSGLQDLRLLQLTQGAGRLAFVSDLSGSAVVVPGLFTRDGFYRVFLPFLPGLASHPTDDEWMFDSQSIRASANSAEQLTQQVTDQYVRDYIAAWTTFLNGLRVPAFRSLDDAALRLEAMSGAESPLRSILMALNQNTDLPPPAPPVTSIASVQQAAQSVAGRVIQDAARITGVQGSVKIAPNIAALATTFGDGNWPGQRIARPFQQLTALVGGGGGGGANAPGGAGASSTAPLETVLSSLASVLGYIKNITEAPDPPSAALRVAGDRITRKDVDALTLARQVADRQPDPLRRWLQAVVGSAWGAIFDTARSSVDAQWQAAVLPEYRRLIQDRYPMMRGAAQETGLKDFGSFFGQNGVIDRFMQTTLGTFVDTSGDVFSNAQFEGQSLGLPTEILTQLRAAVQIRRAFFPDNGMQPALRFTMRPTLLDARVVQVQLTIEGKTISYRHEPPRMQRLQWPGTEDSGTARVAMIDVNNQAVSSEKEGPWALFRLLEEQKLKTTANTSRYMLTINLDGLEATFELRADNVLNPLDITLLRGFQMPDRLVPR